MLSIPEHPLKLLVVGGGGREHALCWKLAQSPLAGEIFCAPGNGGTASEAKTTNVAIDPMDFQKLADFAKARSIDLIVIGPDNPLAAGIVDYLEGKGLRVFGPSKESARLEWSKSYAKHFMEKAGIATCRFLVCNSKGEAQESLKKNPWAQVVKVDGLALGKGVFVCNSQAEIDQALEEIFDNERFGAAGRQVLLEEKIVGEELSLLMLCDGHQLVPLAASQDHKRRFDGDKGPNTGGMGAYSPVSLYTRYRDLIDETILAPLQKALKEEVIAFQGLLYAGIIVGKTTRDVSERAYVLEFNARFGDPETQAILPRLMSDLLPALWACTEGKLDLARLSWSELESCCVVAVADTYPEKSSAGGEIKLPTMPAECFMFHAGTKLEQGKLLTAGGRILSITALGKTLEEASSKAYTVLTGVDFKGIDYRHDIAREHSKCR
jgi:phosphoribosylamine--glycine ligase